MVHLESQQEWSFDLRCDDRARDEFLAFGYVPFRDGAGDPLGLLGAWSKERVGLDLGQAARRGVAAWRQAVHEAAAGVPSGCGQAVMLSGGKDSRAILAALLQEFSPREIVAGTFGVPGELDYDIARRVVRAAGVEHVVLDTRHAPWNDATLVQSVIAQGPPYPFPYPFGQRFLRYQLMRQIGADRTFWDGLSGESVASLPDPTATALSWDATVARWLERKLVDGWRDRVGPGFRPEDSMPRSPFLDRSVLSYRDQLDFGVEERRRTASRIVPGYRILTPFLGGPWLDLMLGVDPAYRVDALLYRQVLARLDTRLFGVPIARSGLPVLTDRPAVARARSWRTRVRTRAAKATGRYVAPTTGANGTIRRLAREPGPLHDLVGQSLRELGQREGAFSIPDPASLRLDGDQHREAVDLLVGYALNLKALDVLVPPTTHGDGGSAAVRGLTSRSGGSYLSH